MKVNNFFRQLFYERFLGKFLEILNTRAAELEDFLKTAKLVLVF